MIACTCGRLRAQQIIWRKEICFSDLAFSVLGYFICFEWVELERERIAGWAIKYKSIWRGYGNVLNAEHRNLLSPRSGRRDAGGQWRVVEGEDRCGWLQYS
jgi:hypothetical protein